MDVEFLVVENDGKRRFQISDNSGDVLLETLQAVVLEYRTPCFLHLYRGSSEPVGTVRVYTEGTHGPLAYFDVEDLGAEFNRVSGEQDLLRLDSLTPDDFQTGDRIVLTVRTQEERADVLRDLRCYKDFFERDP